MGSFKKEGCLEAGREREGERVKAREQCFPHKEAHRQTASPPFGTEHIDTQEPQRHKQLFSQLKSYAILPHSSETTRKGEWTQRHIK